MYSIQPFHIFLFPRVFMDNQSHTTPLSQSNVKEFIDSFDAFIFDCDGVLWRNTGIVDGVEQTMKLLRDLVNKEVFN